MPTADEIPTQIGVPADEGPTRLDTATPADMTLPPPERLKGGAAERPFRYALRGFLARGAMGEIHIAQDLDLRRNVALKRLAGQLLDSGGALARFLREVQVTAQLDHPNVVPVYGLEVTPDGAPAYAMKLVVGRTFFELLKETRSVAESTGRLEGERSLASRLEHFLKVCDAMHYAHAKGVLHRDLKPANLMLGPYNEVYVMDWGLARVSGGHDEEDVPSAGDDADSPEARTRLGAAMGTPAYMSPEQAAGRNDELDARSDQYALGLILFELVTLERAIPGQTVREVMASAAAGERRPVEAVVRGVEVPPELVAVIGRATERAPRERYESVASLADDVRRYLRGEAVLARPDNAFQKLARAIARHRTRTLVGLLTLVALSAVVVAALAVRNENAVNAARERERRLGNLLAQTAQRAERIQSHLLALDAYLGGLSDEAAAAMTQATPPAAARFYLLSDFRSGHGPPDLRPSLSHHDKVSPGHSVFTLAPGLALPEAEDSIRRIASIQDYRWRIFRESLLSVRELPSQREVLPWDEESVPLLWSVVGLADGVSSIYPGTAHVPERYDARERPWYTAALTDPDVAFSAPYVDEKSGELVLAMSRKIRGAKDELLGVVAMELTFRYISKELLARPNAAVDDVMLLGQDGRVIVRSTGRAPAAPAGREAAILEPFPIASALPAIEAGQSGTLDAVWQQRPVVVAFYRLPILEWTYVSVADPGRLFGP